MGLVLMERLGEKVMLIYKGEDSEVSLGDQYFLT